LIKAKKTTREILARRFGGEGGMGVLAASFGAVEGIGADVPPDQNEPPA